MRLWHVELLPYLPDMQFKGQLRELIAIMHDWRDKGQTNHLLINEVMYYPKTELTKYFLIYREEYYKRYGKTISDKYSLEFQHFAPAAVYWSDRVFEYWHDKAYLRICMANLYEKFLGRGKNKVTQAEWERLCLGYQKLTGEDYVI